MTDSPPNDDRMDEIMAALLHQLLHTEGRYDGIKLTAIGKKLDADGRLQVLSKSEADLRAEMKAAEAKPLDSFTKPVPAYRQGYLKSIQYLIDLTMHQAKGALPPADLPGGGQLIGRFDRRIIYQYYFLEGKAGALSHAIEECQGDFTCVAARIRETEERIARNEGPMKPGASPRMYKEGYLVGLNEALAIITRVQQGETFPDDFADLMNPDFEQRL